MIKFLQHSNIFKRLTSIITTDYLQRSNILLVFEGELEGVPLFIVDLGWEGEVLGEGGVLRGGEVQEGQAILHPHLHQQQQQGDRCYIYTIY